MSINLLDAEALLITRLKAQLTGIQTVASAASVAGAQPEDLTPLLPAFFTQPGAGEAVSDAGNGLAAQQEETWIVVGVFKLLPDQTLAATYDTAGDWLGKAAQALAGWAPSASYRPMKYAGRDEPDYAPGYVEFPLRFTVRRMFSGTG